MNYAVAYPRFWLWYFVASVALALVGSILAIGEAFGGTRSSGALSIALEWASLWPLYGYARQVRIKPRWLWLVIFVIATAGMALTVLGVLFVSLSKAWLTPVLYLFPILLFAAPAIFGLHQYVFRSPDIWGEA